jgi:hypothetical protein
MGRGFQRHLNQGWRYSGSDFWVSNSPFSRASISILYSELESISDPTYTRRASRIQDEPTVRIAEVPSEIKLVEALMTEINLY